MPSDESKGSQLDAIGSLAQRQLDNTLDGGSTTKSRRTNHGAEERRNLQLPSIDGEAVEQAVSTGAAKILLAAASAWMRRVP